MKTIHLSSKAKKSLIITGAALICVGVAAFALSLKSGVTATDQNSNVDPSPSSASLAVSISPIEGQKNSDTDGQAAFVPSSGASQSTQLTKIEKPTSTPPKPEVKGDVRTSSNGTRMQPANSALTNKDTKPSYTSKPTAQTTKPSSKPSINNQGQADPVFGNKQGTGGIGTTVGNPGDELTGNKVGIMD